MSHCIFSDTNRATKWRRKDPWNPMTIWRAYVDSVMKGEFDLTRHYTDGEYVFARSFFYGAIDFSRISLQTACDNVIERPY